MDEETARFIRDNLDSRVKLDVALFLNRNRFTVESAAGLAMRIGRPVDEVEPDLREMAAALILRLHGDPEGPTPCLFGFTQEGAVARLFQKVASAYAASHSAVLDQVLEGQARRHNRRVRELRRLDSLKTQFLSVISHELRSPLTAIKGYVELLRAHPDLNAEQRDVFLQTVVVQCDRLATTISNILLAAEIQHEDGWHGECRPLEIGEIVARLVDEAAAGAPKHHFEQVKPPPLPLIRGDETGIEVVVRNLLENAAKFSSEGTTIRVWYERTENAVCLHVDDEGIGISPERLRAVFDRFYQTEYYCTRRTGGSGLGLYLAKQIMEGMGGSIAVRSELGKGTGFTCTFALAGDEGARNLSGPTGQVSAN